MTPEEKRSGSLSEFDQLLRTGVPTGEAILTVAENYGYTPSDFRVIVERLFGDLEAHRAKVARSAERRQAFAKREQEVRTAAASAAEHCYYDCGLDDSASTATPSWRICVERLIERFEINDDDLVQAAREAVYATVERLDRKHGTHAIKLW